MLIGKERLVAQKAVIRAIEKAEMAVEVKEAALSDAQDMAEVLLDAEIRLGEILAAIKPQYAMTSVEGSNRPHRENTLPSDVSYKQSHQAQTLASNCSIVEQAKAKAREKGEIVTARKDCDREKKQRQEEKPLLLPVLLILPLCSCRTAILSLFPPFCPFTLSRCLSRLPPFCGRHNRPIKTPQKDRKGGSRASWSVS